MSRTSCLLWWPEEEKCERAKWNISSDLSTNYYATVWDFDMFHFGMQYDFLLIFWKCFLCDGRPVKSISCGDDRIMIFLWHLMISRASYDRIDWYIPFFGRWSPRVSPASQHNKPTLVVDTTDLLPLPALRRQNHSHHFLNLKIERE